ncbi:MAG: ShlB/FhaC/HecB family hemolysin secretion/activation protein [Gammaproteobacteria bacterium]|nr:ShlB/FhaC/HecB family hemolysin secretion/activation protein [Gammaproteobacteria bacterium]
MQVVIESSAGLVGVTTRHIRMVMLGVFACLSTPALANTPLPLPDLPPLPGGSSQPQTQGELPSPVLPAAPVLDPNQLVFEIPPVFQRPLGVDEGGRVFVRKFVITGVIDDPEAGIIKEEIDARVAARFEELNELLARLRVARQNQEDVGPDGFTPDEREAIVDFMSDVVRDLSPDRQVRAYQSFVDQLRLQRLERNQGLTIGQLQLIADEITRYYRERGYFLARAVVPAQEVVEGIVAIRVLEGRLGQVLSDGNRRYSHSRLQAPFRDLTGKLVTVEKTEDALLTLQGYPGLSAVGVFQPGGEVGEADLLINVSEEDPLDFLVRVDNHGTRFTGENRLLADAIWNNPFGAADYLELTVLQTYSPDNSLFGSLKYQVPFSNPRHKIGIELTNNSFDVDSLSQSATDNDAGGTSDIYRLYYDWNLSRTRARRTALKFDLARKVADTEVFGRVTARDDIDVFGAQFDYELISAETATIVTAYARVDIGLDGALGAPTVEELEDGSIQPPPTIAGVGADFTKASLGMSWLKSMTANQSLLLRANGTYTADPLTSLERFVIGGPASVRGVPSSQFLSDYGAFVSVEWGVRAPGFADKPAFANRNWGDLLRFTVFADYAQGYFNEVGGGSSANIFDDITESGYGIGIEFGLPGSFSLNVQAAWRSGGADENPQPTDPRAVFDDSQYWVDFTWQF